jgi:alpha-tubulin suppressor-like RCC1 family protein/Tfp pilus assembly protein PilV
MHRQKTNRGFALPTILISSVIMIIVLLSAVSATLSTQSAMDSQYYNQLAREAAESGITYALDCIASNNNTAPWIANGAQLKPNLACDGITDTGGSAYVEQTSTVQTSFTVSSVQSDPTSIKLSVTSEVDLLRSSNSSNVWRSYNYATNAQAGTNLSFNTVAFGYAGTAGAYFGTITSDGTLKAVGYNGNGQLGNGTASNTLIPTVFQLPGGSTPAAAYTNFKSGGYSVFVITTDGSVYGSGYNASGELGNGTTTGTSTPVKFALPAGKTAQSIGVGTIATYVTTTDNNMYASGDCLGGELGNGGATSGCSDVSSYVRVALPTPTSDLNTQPTSNMAIDRSSVYVRMAGGRVYGWGSNDLGQLANGTTTDTATPTQIGVYGNSGQAKATGVDFDGDSVFITDDGGGIKDAGRNTYGELAGDKIPIFNTGANGCLDNKTSDGITMQYHACNGTGAQQYQFRSDGSIYNPSSGHCLNNPNLDGTTVQISVCNGSVSQQFVLRDDGTIYFPNKSKCLNNPNLDGVTIQWSTCNVSTSQQFTLPAVSALTNFALPAGAGTAVKVTTDQWFTSVLTSSGQVWSAGLNNTGQLGNGSVSTYQPYPVKFILPSGVTATDICTAAVGPTTSGTSYSNTFVIGSDGKVYGAGANDYGQLGDGTTTDRSTPVAMNGIDGTTEVAQQVQAGLGTVVIFTTDQKVFTIGNNSNGQLGDGTTTNSSTAKANRYTNLLPTAVF